MSKHVPPGAWGDGTEIHPPPSRVNTELTGRSSGIKVIVTKWQWWRLTFEGVTTDTNNFNTGHFSKRWLKIGFKTK